MKSVFALAGALFLLAGCGESLEDTYKDYSGDSKIRYLGRCSQPSVQPGWKHILVTWENSLDPLIDAVKVSWTANDKTESVTLPRDPVTGLLQSSYDIPNLPDGTYEIRCISLTKDGDASLYTPNYARPYTEKHEVYTSFTRGIISYYRVKDNLVLFLDKWNDNIVDFTLNYTNTTGEAKTFDLTEINMGKMYPLKDVDTSAPITLDRIGTLPGSPDLIDFGTYTLTNDRTFSTDFKLLFKRRYNQAILDDAFINSVEELEIDYDINSFNDILYLPNLKKLILGKNRYFHSSYAGVAYTLGGKLVTVAEYCSRVIGQTAAEATAFLEEVNKLTGLTVEFYTGNYALTAKASIITKKTNPTVPVLNYLNTEGWTITSSLPDPAGVDSGIDFLLDNNPGTHWQPHWQPVVARTHQLTIDMGALQTVKGVKIVQKNCSSDYDGWNVSPRTIRVKTSADQLVWEDATGVEDNVIGGGNAETTLIPLKAPKSVRWIRVTVTDRFYGTNYSTNLADIAVYN